MRNLALAVLLVACADRPSSTRRASAPVPIAAPAAPVKCELPPPPAPPEDPDAEPDNHPARVAEAAAGETCGVADDNLRRVEDAIRTARRDAPAVAAKAWDRRAPLERMELVKRRFALLPAEEKLLRENGFVVLARHTFGSYGDAFHEIYQSQVPIYVSVDAILQAIYIANDNLIAELEDGALQPLLASVLDRMACALPAAAAEYPEDTARDVDLYLAVGRALLRGDAPFSVRGDASVVREAEALVKRAIDASEMSTVALFGRDRVVDFTAYTPRGHYTTEPRRRYFRAAMWMSRLELNLVSRSSRSSQPGFVPDPSETPREAVDALALADLVDRAGAAADVARMDGAWALLAGRREDISIAQLGELRKRAGIGKLTERDAAERLRATIGDRFRRTARIHYMPQGSTELPAIATFLGPRIVPDAAATRPLVHGEVPDRNVLRASDMGYVLGHDRAKVHLTADRARWPQLDRQLDAARRIARTAERGRDDLYSAWLDAVMQLATPADGAKPSFMATPAYADLRVNSALAGFGQIKHNYVLLAGESYFEGGCEIPDGYVEPAPAVYDALIEYAARGARSMDALDPDDTLAARGYFRRLGEVLAILRTIQTDELAGRALTPDQKAFLSMVAEALPPQGSGGAPSYTGWWFDLHRRRKSEGLGWPGFIASYFTGEKISYIGASAPRLGVFVIDTGGAPRVAVGPVARAYEHLGPQARRLDDAAGDKLAERERLDPWARSYTAPAVPPPGAFGLEVEGEKVTLTTKIALGTVTIEPYDHHRVPNGPAVTLRVPPGATTFTLRATKPDDTIEGLHLRIGSFHDWLRVYDRKGYAGWKLPARPQDEGPFVE